MNMKKLAALLLLPALLIGCATPSDNGAAQDAPPASTFLNAAEVISHVSGNTETWSKGAGYYSADGQLLVVWEGKNIEGTWSVKSNGRLCAKVAAWGAEDCQQYKDDNGEIQLVYNGKATVREIQPGNQLDKF